MDEPCSALDPISAGAIEELILSLRDRIIFSRRGDSALMRRSLDCRTGTVL